MRPDDSSSSSSDSDEDENNGQANNAQVNGAMNQGMMGGMPGGQNTMMGGATQNQAMGGESDITKVWQNIEKQ